MLTQLNGTVVKLTTNIESKSVRLSARIDMKVFTFFVSFLTFSSCFHDGKTNSTTDHNSTEKFPNANLFGMSEVEEGYQRVLVSIENILELFVLFKLSYSICGDIYSASMIIQQFNKAQKYQHNVRVISKNS